MLQLRVLLTAALCAAIALSGIRAEDKATKYEKPEAAFAAFHKAMKNKDWKTAYAVMTPDSGDKLLGASILGMGQFLALAKENPQLAEKLKPLLDPITKAGIKEDDITTAVKAVQEAKGDEKKTLEAIKKMVGPVKDKGDLLNTLMTTVAKLNPKAVKEPPAEATLKDVKITGDTATGTTVAKKDGKEEETKLTFKKIKDSWHIELPDPKKGK